MSGDVLRRIGVLGAGAWGTALSQVAARAGRHVRLWALEADLVADMIATRENRRYLPGIDLEPQISPTADMADMKECDAILVVAPAQHVRATLKSLAPHARKGLAVVLCAKGVEQGTLKLMTDVLADEVPLARAAVLSGPSFARDVANGLPTAVTLACKDAALGKALVETLGLATFRPYYSDDVVGAEIGGAVKNVLAIACGVVEGKGFGDSARAALIARGFAEMTRLGLALGARRETLAGLSGLGDLILTCSSRQSRNFSVGLGLAAGAPLSELTSGASVAEGVTSASAVVQLADRHGVEMPISAAVDEILSGRSGVDAAIMGLLSRPFRAEGG